MRKSIASICLLLMLATIAVILPQPSVQAQQNIASNTLGCTLSGLLATGTATTKVVSASPATTSSQSLNGVITSVPTTKAIKICAFFLDVNQAAGAANFGLIQGTGTNCATAPVNVTPQVFGTASVKESKQQEFGQGTYLIVPAGKDLCMKVSATPTDMAALILYKYE